MDHCECRAIASRAREHSRHAEAAFEPAEVEKILKACREVQIQGCSNDELLAFTLVLRYSVLRIGDASMLTVDRFKGDDLYLYTQKSGTHVFELLPPFVMNLVRAIQPKHGEYLFTGPESLRCSRNQETRLISCENRHPAMDPFHDTARNPEGCVSALGPRLRPVDANNARFIPEDVAHRAFAKPHEAAICFTE